MGNSNRQSTLGGHVGGHGTTLAFIEPDDSYTDHKERAVRLPSDEAVKKDYASLCGPVVVSRLPDSGNRP